MYPISKNVARIMKHLQDAKVKRIQTIGQDRYNAAPIVLRLHKQPLSHHLPLTPHPQQWDQLPLPAPPPRPLNRKTKTLPQKKRPPQKGDRTLTLPSTSGP